MNASQMAGLSVLFGVLGYPLLVWITESVRKWKARRLLKKMGAGRFY
jgi:hypothetical protein